MESNTNEASTTNGDVEIFGQDTINVFDTTSSELEMKEDVPPRYAGPWYTNGVYDAFGHVNEIRKHSDSQPCPTCKR